MLSETLGKIHARHSVFPKPLVTGEVQKNIIEDIRDIPDFCYLADYYDAYFQAYVQFAEDTWSNTMLSGDARSTHRSVPLRCGASPPGVAARR